MDDSTLSKIKSESRQVRFEELAAFAEVFEIPPVALLQPLELAQSEELNAQLEELNDRREDLLRATAAVVPVVKRAAALALEAPRPYTEILDATPSGDRDVAPDRRPSRDGGSNPRRRPR